MLNYEFVCETLCKWWHFYKLNKVMYGKGLHFLLFTLQTYYSIMMHVHPGKQVSWPLATSWSNGVGSPPSRDVIPDICYMMLRVVLSPEGWVRTLPSRSGLLEDILYGNIQGVIIYHAIVVMVAQPGCVNPCMSRKAKVREVNTC
jgi:hypothetical protein